MPDIMTQQGDCESPDLGEPPVEQMERVKDTTPGRKMDVLKDLPSYNASNFSRYTTSNGMAKPKTMLSHRPRSYICLKSSSDDKYKPQVIVMDSESLILTELQAILSRQQARKRSLSHHFENGSQSDPRSRTGCKVPRTDSSELSGTDDDNLV